MCEYWNTNIRFPETPGLKAINEFKLNLSFKNSKTFMNYFLNTTFRKQVQNI